MQSQRICLFKLLMLIHMITGQKREAEFNFYVRGDGFVCENGTHPNHAYIFARPFGEKQMVFAMDPGLEPMITDCPNGCFSKYTFQVKDRVVMFAVAHHCVKGVINPSTFHLDCWLVFVPMKIAEYQITMWGMLGPNLAEGEFLLRVRRRDNQDYFANDLPAYRFQCYQEDIYKKEGCELVIAKCPGCKELLKFCGKSE